MNRQIDLNAAPVEAVAVLSEMDAYGRPEDLADGSLFGETWAARHNQEIWLTAPSGMYEASPPPCRA